MKTSDDEALEDILKNLMVFLSKKEKQSSEMDMLIRRVRAMRTFHYDLEIAKILAEEGYEAGLVYLCMKVAKLADEEKG
jgi:hypothetical protein